MKKRGYLLSGIAFIVLSLLLIYSYLTTTREFAIAILSTEIGVIGLILLPRSEKINNETAILSILLVVLGGFIVPLLSLSKEISTPMIALAYIAVILLLILKPPEEKHKEMSVHQ